ncbi:MAG TPA: metalloregulator ArsR/SmtB family transcription factor [Hyphomicrobiales bacterium]|nr:metalloregulator ArsR/SmtB family transcription factor [Hyphomicrobiales bacterium]
MPNHDAALDPVFHALADPTRRAVLQRLGKGPATVSELARPFDMALPSFLQHLRVLEAGGLIRSKKAGRVRTCEIDMTPLTRAENWLAENRAMWVASFERLGEFLNEAQRGENNGE